MTSHSRLSPGVEIREIDRSQYGKQDYSIVGTTALAIGFAQKGEDYAAQWVNTIKTFNELYGQPANEPERYLYNCAKEIIDRGGVALVAKLPYDNKSKDSFTAVTYQLIDPMQDSGLSGLALQYVSDISAVDGSLTAVLSIGLAADSTERVTLSAFDRFKTSNSLDQPNTRNKIKIIDITRGHYGKMDLTDGSNNIRNGVECLGVMPVVTTAANAMFYQGIISSVTSCNVGTNVEHTSNIERYTPVSNACNRISSDVARSLGVDQSQQLTSYTHYQLDQFIDSNSVIPISSATIAGQCVAKMAAQQFPNIGFMLSGTVDREYVKHIGLVVFNVFKDESNDNKINFEVAEAYTGSLDRNAKNERTGASDYIGDIVNSKSKLVNLFANVQVNDSYKKAQTIVTSGQTAPILGFAECECAKHIDYKTSVIDSLNIVLDRIRDPNQYGLDIIADAGLTNIAAFAAQHPEDKKTDPIKYDLFNSDTYPFFQSENYHQTGTLLPWEFDTAKTSISSWFTVMKKLDDFCKYERRDCVFIGDMFRPVVLDGNEKIVRNTNRSNTIANALLPKMKYVTGLNSSYSACYANWFYAMDSLTDSFFWCPPSIKAAGVYVYTDAYFHPWDAPAGLNRGVVPGVYDVSFNPMNDEAGKIYQQAWNYAVSYPVEGIVIEGQKTCQLKPTALDRVNVRRLMLWLEKRVVAVARRFLYEGNTSYMRQRFVDSVRPIFEEAKTGNGLSDYAIRCDDELNNTNVIDNNELRCIIAVKPIKTIEYIKLGFIITNQSADVNEEVMK